ncbi:MAG TPA: PGPGW domain-containing protein [Terriglobales bacterium]|nr:PGPGW domain-containing protein [Terriglobales bacterium]
MRSAAKRVAVLLLGWAFVLLGIAGLFLPVLQGVLFLLIGLIILSSEYLWAQKLLQRLRNRFPGVVRKSDEAQARAARWMRRMFGAPH